MVKIKEDYQIDPVKITDEERNIIGGNIPVNVDIISSLPAGTNTIGKFKITNGTTDAVICSKCGGLIVKDAISRFLGLGYIFTASHLFTGVADDGYAYVRIKTHADYYAFLNLSIESEAKVYGCLYEDSTFSANGTVVTAYNNNRVSTNNSHAIIYHTPTIDATGICIRHTMLGSAGKFTESSGSASSIYARKLDNDSEYLVAVQNKGGSAKDIAIRVRFYEIEV